MEKLHSTGSQKLKYIIPILFLPILLVAFCAASQFENNTIPYLIIFIICCIGFSIYRNFLLDLKEVFIDEHNKEFEIHGGNRIVRISFNDIKSAEYSRIARIPIISLYLKKQTLFGDEIVFMPSGFNYFDSPIAKRLNRIVENGNSANSSQAQ